jgi:hypothetical protein
VHTIIICEALDQKFVRRHLTEAVWGRRKGHQRLVLQGHVGDQDAVLTTVKWMQRGQPSCGVDMQVYRNRHPAPAFIQGVRAGQKSPEPHITWCNQLKRELCASTSSLTNTVSVHAATLTKEAMNSF